MATPLKDWKFRKLRNFVIYSVAVLGTPMFFVATLLRSTQDSLWYTALDGLLAAGGGACWGVGMWFLYVKSRLTEMRRPSGVEQDSNVGDVASGKARSDTPGSQQIH
jgi:hypothetical protein